MNTRFSAIGISFIRTEFSVTFISLTLRNYKQPVSTCLQSSTCCLC